MATPYEIEILLHLYCTPVKIKKIRNDLFYQTMDKFVEMGLVIRGAQISNDITDAEYEKEFHKNEEPLKIYIEALMSVQLPIQVWVLPIPPVLGYNDLGRSKNNA